MFKVFLLLHLCVCVINCEQLKCDIKNVRDIKTKEIVDKSDFCKNKDCVFRQCVRPNTMLVQFMNGTVRCRRWDWVKKYTHRNLNIPVYKSDFTKSEKNIKDLRFVVLHNKTLKEMTEEECVENSIITLSPGNYDFLEDGSLRVKSPGKDNTYPSQTFFVEFRVKQISDDRWEGPDVTISKLLTINDGTTQQIYQAIGMLISCVFLILVLVVYCMFKQLRGHYGKILMAYIACFTATYALMAAMRLSIIARLLEPIHCKCISPLLYFLILTTFFWLNVMSYEIWNTFRPKNEFRSPESRGHRHRFLRAALYAVGVPLLMMVALVVIDELKLTKFRPNYENCMHSEQVYLFHYVPMAIIFFVNLGFFVMTSYYLWQQRKGNALNSTESRITRRNQNIFGLYLKLSMSTGVNWVLDVITVYATIPDYLLYIFDTYTLLLGVIVFLVCVCNERVLKLLSKRIAINSHFVNQSSLNTTATDDSKKNRSMKKKTSIQSNL